MDDLRELYQEVILEHVKNPRNKRTPEDANRHAHGHNPICGDAVEVHLKINGQGVIEDVAFEGKGCAISVASASLMTEELMGKTEAQAKALFETFQEMCTKDDAKISAGVDEDTLERMRVLAGVREFPMRVKCATLAWHTMSAAMARKDGITTEQEGTGV
jgi:nitrogen fixation protein NifU and related proteins